MCREEEQEQEASLPNAKTPLWKQRRYQFAFLGLVVVAGAAVAVGLIVPRSVGNTVTPSTVGSPPSDSFQGDDDSTGDGTGAGATLGPFVIASSSSAPSLVASSSPSLAPSTTPTTSKPSIAPSTSPSSAPSQLPSRTPTAHPSNDSTKAPSASATPTFTEAPSTPAPSDTPTDHPSLEPSTGLPSLLPSRLPSKSPSVSPTTKAPSLSAAPSSSADETFGFYLMGDIPYAPWEETMLNDQITNMTRTRQLGTHFTVHVGDIQKPGRTSCLPNAYQKMHAALTRGPLPTFVIPGDNDWFDCPEPEESLELFRDTLTNLEDKWYDSVASVLPDDVVHMAVEHQAEYPEMWTFSHQGILFVSIHLIDTKPSILDGSLLDADGNVPEGVDPAWDEWNKRMAANVDWFWKAMSDHGTAQTNGSASPLKAVVLFGHGQISADTREFFEAIQPLFFSFNPRLITLPVMYLHGDGHKWDMDDRIRNQLSWSSFIDIQVDQGANADPCIVEIATNPNTPLTVEHENQHVFADGLFRIDRQRGRYPARG